MLKIINQEGLILQLDANQVVTVSFITDNSTNWNTAYSQTRQWDGGAIQLQTNGVAKGLFGVMGYLLGNTNTDIAIYASSSNGINFLVNGSTTPSLAISSAGNTSVYGLVNLKNYTVATLPAGTRGDIAYVTDALAPSYLVTVVGGGTIVTPVFYNGTSWVAY